MHDYRLYTLDENGKICGVKEVSALDDDTAIAHARQLNHPRGVVIWQRARFVGELQANGGEVLKRPIR